MTQPCPYCNESTITLKNRLAASIFAKEIRCTGCQTRLRGREINLWVVIPLPLAAYYFGFGWGMYLILFFPLLTINLLICFFSPLKVQGLRRFKKNNGPQLP